MITFQTDKCEAPMMLTLLLAAIAIPICVDIILRVRFLIRR